MKLRAAAIVSSWYHRMPRMTPSTSRHEEQIHLPMAPGLTTSVAAATPSINLDAYIRNIDSAEVQEYSYSTVYGVLQEVQLLGARSTETRAAGVMRAMTPLISFIDRYSKAVDNITQYPSNPASLIWGCLRVLLRVSSSPLANGLILGTGQLLIT